MCMPVGPCRYTWLMVQRGRLHTDAILRISSAAVKSSRYRAWYTAHTQQLMLELFKNTTTQFLYLPEHQYVL